MLHMLIPRMSLAEVDKNQEMCGSNPRQMGHGFGGQIQTKKNAIESQWMKRWLICN